MSDARCRYIAGDPHQILFKGEAIYCGKPALPGEAWCKQHHAICYPPALQIEPMRQARAAARTASPAPAPAPLPVAAIPAARSPAAASMPPASMAHEHEHRAAA